MPCLNTFRNANRNVQLDCAFLAEADHRPVQTFAGQIGANLTIERGGAEEGPTFQIGFPLAENISARAVAP